MSFSKYLAQINDPYERKARLWPGLLVVAPIVIALVDRYGAKHPVLAAAASVLGASGGMYGLASIVRGRGKACEDRLVSKWGGMPTTIALRHRDEFLDSNTKQRYHELISRKLGLSMPTVEDEKKNPVSADDVYIGATKRLRELTRNDKGLLFKENIAYGFHRNMLGMKPIGIAICLFAVLQGLLQANLLQPNSPQIVIANLRDVTVSTGITFAVAFIFLAAWTLYFMPSAVRRIGFVYAERLFERLPSLKVAGSSRSSNETRTE